MPVPLYALKKAGRVPGDPQRAAQLDALDEARRFAERYIDYRAAVDAHLDAGLVNPYDEWPLDRVKPAASAFTAALQLVSRGRHLAVAAIVVVIDAQPLRFP